MRQILSDIRALPGVTGVAVIAKRTGQVEHVFPAAFTDNHTQFLRDLITTTHQKLRGFTRLFLRFERVIVHLYNQPEFLLFVTVLPDTETRQFETVVNSKINAIARQLGHPAATAMSQPTIANPTQSAASGRTTHQASTTNPSTETIPRLLVACNKLSDEMAEAVGRMTLANNWRRARTAAIQDDMALEGILIDAASHLHLRKGATITVNAVTIAALAKMIDAFFESLGGHRVAAEEHLYVFLEPHRSLFESAGFYAYLSRRTRTKTQK
jgi:hypothetical protein